MKQPEDLSEGGGGRVICELLPGSWNYLTIGFQVLVADSLARWGNSYGKGGKGA